MGSIIWGPEMAQVYDKTYAATFAPPVLGRITGLLADLARGGPRWSSRPGRGGWRLR